MKEYVIQNYIDDNGNSPIRTWLDNLDHATKDRILMRLRRLELGNFGDYKQLNDFLYELRFHFGSGYRVYFTIQDNLIILLINGGNKKTQAKDINNANEIVRTLKGYNYEA